LADCPIWGVPADLPQDRQGDTVFWDSPRAGGRYAITGSAYAISRSLDDNEKALLTAWLCNQRRAGQEYPRISADVISAIKTFRRLTTTERIERALLYFNDTLRVGEKLTILMGPTTNTDERAGYSLAAITECRTKEELIAFLQLLVEMGLIADTGNKVSFRVYSPTARGWLRIDELVSKLPNTTQAFVAMWFNDATTKAYEDGIAPAIRDAGYQPARIDQKEHSNKIDDEIVAEIRRSKFLVADFTCEREKVRGGVYFEAGFAMGLGIPVIWTVRKDALNDVHFDTRQYNHIVWDTPESLRSQLSARIGAVIGDGPLKS
jgi:nucleoside 2-deoxyribosyltransferase